MSKEIIKKLFAIVQKQQKIIVKMATIGARPSWWNEPDPSGDPIGYREEVDLSSEEVAREAARNQQKKHFQDNPHEHFRVKSVLEDVAKWEHNLAKAKAQGEPDHQVQHCERELAHFKKLLEKTLKDIKWGMI